MKAGVPLKAHQAGQNHAYTPWGSKYVVSPEILTRIDPTFEPDKSGYIIEMDRRSAKIARLPYYTDRELSFDDVPVVMLAKDGSFHLGVVRYVSNNATLGQVRKNLRASRARRKQAKAGVL